MWKSESTLKRQLRESREESKKLKEQLETTKRMLEHQVGENKRQDHLLRTYHRCTHTMLHNKAKGFCNVLKALEDEFNGFGHFNNYAKDDYEGFFDTEGIGMILGRIYKEIRSETESRHYSVELLKLLEKTERGYKDES